MKDVFIIILLIFSLGGSIAAWLNEPKIGYVNNNTLITQYQGMKEAAQLYQKKKILWQGELDSLSNKYRLALEHFYLDSLKMVAAEKRAMKNTLYRQREHLMNYKQKVEEQALEEDNKMTSGVVNQINSFIEKYADDNGFTLILGANDSGSLLYAEKGIDITEDVLNELNKDYKGQ